MNNCFTKPKVVLIGGGSGLATVLKGLKNLDFEISAIVTMTDDGRSSGRLRGAIAVNPPGDIRKCITSLSQEEEMLTKLFEYRFKKIRGLNDHSLGNLILVALTEITGSFEKAINATSKILNIAGNVIPSTLQDVRLAAKLQNNQIVLGEEKIPIFGHRSPIQSIMTIPEKVRANPMAINAIKQADYIIVGPGSLYTSVLSNFIIKDIKKEFIKSRAKKIFVCNISTERGETEGFSVERHYREICKYTKTDLFDFVLVNNNILVQGKEGKLGAITNIKLSEKKLNGTKVISVDLIDLKHPLYHSSEKLKKSLSKIIMASR